MDDSFRKSQFFFHPKFSNGVPADYEKILLKTFCLNHNTYPITISPPTGGHVDDQMKLIHWYLQNKQYFLVSERDKKNRLHWHGVVKLCSPQNITAVQFTLTRNIGYSFIKKSNPDIGWYNYIFKDYPKGSNIISSEIVQHVLDYPDKKEEYELHCPMEL